MSTIQKILYNPIVLRDFEKEIHNDLRVQNGDYTHLDLSDEKIICGLLGYYNKVDNIEEVCKITNISNFYSRKKSGYTNLMEAIIKKDIASIKNIIDQSAESVLQKTHDNTTVLMVAVQYNASDMLKIILDVDHSTLLDKNDAGNTAISEAVRLGYFRCLSILLYYATLFPKFNDIDLLSLCTTALRNGFDDSEVNDNPIYKTRSNEK